MPFVDNINKAVSSQGWVTLDIQVTDMCQLSMTLQVPCTFESFFTASTYHFIITSHAVVGDTARIALLEPS